MLLPTPLDVNKYTFRVRPYPLTKIPDSWSIFASDFNTKFIARLRKFRGDDILDPPVSLRGGEGQLFISQRKPKLTLKRWYKSRLGVFAKSVGKLKEVKSAINKNSKLSDDIEVVNIYEKGNDWILRDFDRKTVPLKDALSSPSAKGVRERVIQELERSQNPVLIKVLKKLVREPPSENIHWSGSKKKIVIIDMM